MLDQRPTFAVIALNAPVGYLDLGRPAAGPATAKPRALLGPSEALSIQSAPVRSPTNELEFLPDHLDAISKTLLPRYREVAGEMAPFRQRTVYEVHSDMSFYELNDGQPMQWPKNTETGSRSGAAFSRRSSPASTGSSQRGSRGVISHLIDVAVFVWTARQDFRAAAHPLPEDPEWDEQGLRMEILR